MPSGVLVHIVLESLYTSLVVRRPPYSRILWRVGLRERPWKILSTYLFRFSLETLLEKGGSGGTVYISVTGHRLTGVAGTPLGLDRPDPRVYAEWISGSPTRFTLPPVHSTPNSSVISDYLVFHLTASGSTPSHPDFQSSRTSVPRPFVRTHSVPFVIRTHTPLDHYRPQDSFVPPTYSWGYPVTNIIAENAFLSFLFLFYCYLHV